MLPKSDERTSDTNFKAINAPLKENLIIPFATEHLGQFRKNQIKLSSADCTQKKKSPDHFTSIFLKAKEPNEKCD
jgi:hypothetical protein